MNDTKQQPGPPVTCDLSLCEPSRVCEGDLQTRTTRARAAGVTELAVSSTRPRLELSHSHTAVKVTRHLSLPKLVEVNGPGFLVHGSVHDAARSAGLFQELHRKNEKRDKKESG